MHSKIIFIILVTFIIGCSNKAEKQLFSIDRLYLGFTSYHAFLSEKKDSAKYFPPPAPPFTEEIANNNIIEAVDGRIFFYSFPRKEPLCGYMTEGGKYVFEAYLPDLERLSFKSLILVDANNIDSIIQQITTGEKPHCLSIGLQQDSSTNVTLVNLTTRLYRNSVNNVWKVRKIDRREQALLSQS